jgi:hypothetical protein
MNWFLKLEAYFKKLVCLMELKKFIGAPKVPPFLPLGNSRDANVLDMYWSKIYGKNLLCTTISPIISLQMERYFPSGNHRHGGIYIGMHAHGPHDNYDNIKPLVVGKQLKHVFQGNNNVTINHAMCSWCVDVCVLQ